jgi:hypothetical protein
VVAEQVTPNGVKKQRPVAAGDYKQATPTGFTHIAGREPDIDGEKTWVIIRVSRLGRERHNSVDPTKSIAKQ